MQTPTLCRTSPALETVQGVTNIFLLRVGHPALPHLMWINWGKHHKLIPSQRPHPWGHSIHQTNTDWSEAFDKQKNVNITNILKSCSYTHLNGLLCPHGSSWIPCVLWGPRDAQSQAAKARLKLKEKQSMFIVCPRKHQYCFWAGTASFCSPEFREQTMAKDFTWHQ